jgi:hypothetical protein
MADEFHYCLLFRGGKMNYYIGQKIVAISTCRDFKKGDEFVIKGIYPSKCKCKTVMLDIGISELSVKIGARIFCVKCAYEFPWNGINTYKEKWFAPLQDISETMINEFIENMEIIEPILIENEKV